MKICETGGMLCGLPDGDGGISGFRSVARTFPPDPNKLTCKTKTLLNEKLMVSGYNSRGTSD